MARIGVIGAGIIGSAVATWLLAEGHEVTVFESDAGGVPTSGGNAALIALPEVAPLAHPSMLTAVPRWLADPLGPLTVRWSDAHKLAPWVTALLASATPGRIRAHRDALTFLMRTALADHQTLAKHAGLTGHLKQTGYLSISDTEGGVRAGAAEAEAVREVLGFDYEMVSTEAARKLVPQLEGQFAGGIYQPVYWMVNDPLDVMRALQQHNWGRGRIVHAQADGLVSTDTDVLVRHPGGAAEPFDFVVVAAGIWSRELVRRVGLKVLLETERGYNTTFEDLPFTLPMPVGFADHGFITSPLARNRLRVGGAVELATPEAPPNFARAKAMRTKMRRYVPALPEGGAEWMGRRPSTPDSVPVISRHPRDSRILFAFGHGHLGLTLSAVTARHIARLVAGANDPALAPFAINRFQ